MGRIFGTGDGPAVREGHHAPEMEVRMEAVASILDFDAYRVEREEAVAGELDRAVRVLVTLRFGRQEVPRVPFVAVRDGRGDWLVREVGLTAVMNRR